VRHVLAVVLFVAAVAPAPTWAAGCDEQTGQTVQISGSYLPSRQAYARSFVFAMLWECDGAKEVVTVQRPTGNLPVCEPQEQVEVVGKLIWNKALVDGHFEINNPSSVTCRPEARGVASGTQPSQPAQVASQPPPVQPAPLQPVPPVRTEPPRTQARAVGSSVWVGRYQDSRGAGDVSFTLVRGESTVSGTWKLRTGGGGPVTGVVEAGGRRMQLRMENIAPECPGLLEGSAEITDTNIVATYRGKDCEGAVTGGRLELRLQ
jgi:hypothetical protein